MNVIPLSVPVRLSLGNLGVDTSKFGVQGLSYSDAITRRKAFEDLQQSVRNSEGVGTREGFNVNKLAESGTSTTICK